MRMTPIAALLLAFSATAFSACKARPGTTAAAADSAAAPRAHVIEDIPTLARARQIDTTGSADAERVTWLLDGMPFDSVTAYYRHLLPTMGYAVMNDQSDANEVNLYTRNGTKAVWIHFEKKGPTTTQWTIIGTDSSTAGKPAPAASTTPRP